MTKLESLFQELIEASGESDRKVQVVASEFFDKIKKFLMSPGGTKKLFRADLGGGDFGLALDAGIIDIRFNDLFFVFTRDASSHSSASFRDSSDMPGKKFMIAMSVLPPKTQIGRIKNIDISKKEQAFIHEFVHYLDRKRQKGEPSNNNYMSGSSDYYNSPHEFNAYYQAGATILTDIINGLVKQNRLSAAMSFLSSFDSFKNLAFSHPAGSAFQSKWVNALNDKNKRKLILRLHKLYEFLLSSVRGDKNEKS